MSQLVNFLYRIRKFLQNERALLILALLAIASISINELSYSDRPGSGHVSSSKHKPPSQPMFLVPVFFKDWRERFLKSNKPTDSLGLVRSIVLGDDSAIPEDVRRIFRESGLYHLLAADGYKCWMVAFWFSLISKFIFNLLYPYLPSLLALKIKRTIKPLASLLGAWLYFLWTTQAQPIARALVMISIKWILDLFELKVPFGRLLLIQYLVSLTIMPRLWNSASFQLTFGCIAGILIFPMLVEVVWEVFYSKPHKGWQAILWEYFTINTGACLGTIPTTWLAFGEINFNSVLTNWFAIPLVTVAMMPIGLTQMGLLIYPHSVVLMKVALLLGGLNAWTATAFYKLTVLYMHYVPSLRYAD